MRANTESYDRSDCNTYSKTSTNCES